MSLKYPYHYQNPFNNYLMCNSGKQRYGTLPQGCEYIERATYNRFDRPPTLYVDSLNPSSTSSLQVSSLFYSNEEKRPNSTYPFIPFRGYLNFKQ